MAVYRRAYRPYEGPLTSEHWRFLVVTRYALQELVESRVILAFVFFCLAPFLVEAAGVYVSNSAPARLYLKVPGAANPLRPEFFLGALTLQGLLAVVLNGWVAPVLVAPDLANGALPLYLSRPFSRADYVLGKMAVMLALLSFITWVPGLLLFALQAGLTDPSWLRVNLRTAGAIFVGSWVWITVLTLLGLAVSASVRQRIVASGVLFGIFFVGLALAEVWANVLKQPWGRLGNLPYVIGIVWRHLFGIEDLPFWRGIADPPLWAAWATLAAVGALSIALLRHRIRAREVVS